MATLWVFVIVFNGPPIIESQWATEALCMERVRHYTAEGEWLSACLPLLQDNWPVIRVHR